MMVRSFMNNGANLAPIEVEIQLLPGLPDIKFIGLPDQHLRESVARIKSAIRAQGFQFPRAQQVVVNLRPNHIKKSSLGLDLAVGAAILMATDQVDSEWIKKNNLFFYGELTLDGDVMTPPDIDYISDGFKGDVLTGSILKTNSKDFLYIQNLKQLGEPRKEKSQTTSEELELRPQTYSHFQVSDQEALFLKLAAIGRHHSLLAGASGAGKTTLAHMVHQLLPSCFGRSNWWPLLAPHHTCSEIALIGGGPRAMPGEVIKANGGIILLDEFLEFNVAVQEALREPMEKGKIRISRGVEAREYTCKTQVIATTNLCPCGDWAPGHKPNCRYSLRRCQSVLDRLSGPIVDRFELLFFKQPGQSKKTQNFQDILNQIEDTRAWMKLEDRVLPRIFEIGSGIQLEKEAEKLLDIYMPISVRSHRRVLAILRVAKTISYLNYQPQMRGEDIVSALDWAFYPFEKLRLGMLN